MLSQISISHLRNISQAQLSPSSGVNLVLGDNGSGKTTLLEAIHLLALGRSFRTRFLKNIVQFKQQQAQVIGRISNEIPIGLQFSHTSGLDIRSNNAPVKKLSELATQLPLQLIPANCHQLFEQGPRYRRQLLDWGLFHVEPEFNYHWQSYRKVLKQRNASLKQRKAKPEIQLWDEFFIQHGEAITQHRLKQLHRLLEQFTMFFTVICPEFQGIELSLKYRTGWPKDVTLKEAISSAIERDMHLGYTRNGSHAADWSFKVNDADPAEMFSRGQQKLFFIALCMAQAKLNLELSSSSTSSIMLVDDISSELDLAHQKLVLNQLSKLSVQCFISSTEQSLSDLINDNEMAVFHVKQGAINSVK